MSAPSFSSSSFHRNRRVLSSALSTESTEVILIIGPSGSGKTALVESALRDLDGARVFRLGRVYHALEGESELALKRQLERTRQSILIIDDADILVGDRRRSSSPLDRRLCGQICRSLDRTSGPIKVLATCRRIDDIDRSFRVLVTRVLRTKSSFHSIPRPSSSSIALPGLDNARRLLMTCVVDPIRRPSLVRRIGRGVVRPPRGVLIHGPSGTGKTRLAAWLAHVCSGHASIRRVSCPALLSRVVGRTERNVTNVFRRARENAPSLIFMDNIESIARLRSSDDGTTENTFDRLLSTLLVEMDGATTDESAMVVVVAATSTPANLDPAILRPGRLEVRVRTTIPNAAERAEIFSHYLAPLPMSVDSTAGDLARELASYRFSEGLTGGDIEGVCRESAMRALRVNPDRPAVRIEDLFDIAKNQRRSLSI